jgi:predicted dehydrogenase
MIIDNKPSSPPAAKVPRRVGIRRVGIAGGGWVTQYHLPAWRAQSRRAEIVAIADPDEQRVLARCQGHDIPVGFASVDALLKEADIDILDICSPRELHAPLVRLAADRGLAVICQKPLATTYGEAEALVASLGSEVRVMVHDNWRFRATYRRIREWLDAGHAGDLRRVELHYLSSGMIPGPDGKRPAIVRQPIFPTLSRLLVMEALIHQLDALRFLLGELELVDAVIARSNDDIIGEDSATLSLRRRSDGIPVEIVGDLAVHGEPPQARDQLRIIGSRGTITLDGYDVRCIGAGTDILESFDPVATYDGSYVNAIAHFLDCLETGAPFETNLADNLKTLALVEAAYASAGEFTGGRLMRYARSNASRGP